MCLWITTSPLLMMLAVSLSLSKFCWGYRFCTEGGRQNRKNTVFHTLPAKPAVFPLDGKVIQLGHSHSCCCAFQPLGHDVVELCSLGAQGQSLPALSDKGILLLPDFHDVVEWSLKFKLLPSGGILSQSLSSWVTIPSAFFFEEMRWGLPAQQCYFICTRVPEALDEKREMHWQDRSKRNWLLFLKCILRQSFPVWIFSKNDSMLVWALFRCSWLLRVL